MTRNCKYCDEPIAEGIIYCPKCGNPATDEEATHIHVETTTEKNEEVMPEPAPEPTPEPNPEPNPEPAIEPMPEPKKRGTRWGLVTFIVLLLAALLGAVGGYLYVTNRGTAPDKDAKVAEELPTIIVNEEAETEAETEVENGEATAFDYGTWNDLNEYFDAEAVGMLDHGKYAVNTVELCRNAHSWRKPSIGKNEKTAVVYAHPSLRIRNYPATDSRSVAINGLGYGTKVRIVEIVDGDWAKVEYISGELDNMSVIADGKSLQGYVNTSFLVNEKLFGVMDRHITASEEDKSEFDVSKWRRATTDLIYVLGATATGPKIDVEVEEVWTYEDDNTGEELETLVIFSIEREDSDVELLAFVEFYADDEEYRFLGVVPGNSVLNVKMLGSGNYDIIYAAE